MIDYGAETRNRLRYGMIEGGFSIEVAVSISARCLQVEDISMVAGFYVLFYDKMVSWCVGGAVTQRSAKPRRPVQLWYAPPDYLGQWPEWRNWYTRRT